MSSDFIQKLHKAYTSGTYSKKHGNPIVEKMLDAPHLAVFINGDWLPILPGMILGLITNRQHVDGIAPYKVKKVNWKPGQEHIDLIAWSSDGHSGRELRLGARYRGHYNKNADNEKLADAAIKKTK